MRNNHTLPAMTFLILALLVGVAAAWAAEPGEQASHGQKKVCLLVGSGEPATLDLDDLKDGESRTVASGDRQITVTRKGDDIEVTAVEKDGTRRILLDTTLDKDRLLHDCLAEHGGKSHRVIVHATGTGSGEMPFLVQTEKEGDEAVVVKKVVVRSSKEGSSDLTIDTELAGPGCALQAPEDLVTFRCKEDGAMVSIPKAKEAQVAPACPVCGKQMDKVKAHQVVVCTTVGDDKGEI